MTSDDRLRALERRCEDAAVGYHQWSELLREVAEWVGGDKAMIMGSANMGPYRHSLTYNHDPEQLDLYNRHFNRHDPRLRYSSLTAPGKCQLGQNYVANRDIHHTEYFNEINVAGDTMDSVHGVLCDDHELGRHAISVQRPFSAEFFGDEELRRLAAILPFLSRALRQSVRITQVLGERVSGDKNANYLIDGDLNLLPLGPEPTDLFAACSAFASVNGKLLFETEAIAETARRAAARSSAGQGIAFEVRANDGSVVRLRFSPLPGFLDWLAPSESCALLNLAVMRQRPDEEILLFSSAFALSDRETDVLCALGNEPDNRGAASVLGMRYETLRWHLKSIFAKTGYARRDELLEAARCCDLTNAGPPSG